MAPDDPAIRPSTFSHTQWLAAISASPVMGDKSQTCNQSPNFMKNENICGVVPVQLPISLRNEEPRQELRRPRYQRKRLQLLTSSRLRHKNSRLDSAPGDALVSPWKLSTLLAIVLEILPALTRECYSLSGKVTRSVVPCSNSTSSAEESHSACCNPDFYDACLSSGLCLSTGQLPGRFPGQVWADGCTDPTGEDPACPQLSDICG